MEQKFNDLNIDAILGSEMMLTLGLSRIDLDDPRKFSKLREVISFFGKFPPDQRDSILRRITLGKDSKIDRAWEYAVLSQRHAETNKILEEKRNLLESVTLAGEDVTGISSEVENLQKQVDFLTKEVQIYG